MKPQQLPEDLRDDPSKPWDQWPRIEILQAESGATISKLRSKLKDVPCYRCPDRSVRYEPAAARTALYDSGDDDDDSPAGNWDDIDADSMSTKAGALGLLALVFREQMRANAETRRERQDTIRAMQAPLETGLRLTENLVKSLTERLTHLEGIWGSMIELTESMQALKEQRALEAQKQHDSAAMRKHALGLLDKHGPMLWSKWTLTREAQLALQFLGSLDDRIVEMVRGSGVLDADQEAMLGQLAAALAKRKADAAAAAATPPPDPPPQPDPPAPAAPAASGNHAAAA